MSRIVCCTLAFLPLNFAFKKSLIGSESMGSGTMRILVGKWQYSVSLLNPFDFEMKE
ncbi:hypothetical protein HQQ94_09880 [Shewanella sp. VB17]|uniref:hypothetical protein n=1 Tax=Shewanella sp. VB17 TaxID=2739432 RepID=UPI0015643204|nr:hypothetical protein [Shewanella sp. VB17]NRD73550.1 hypothetical protein [Shewanella sp. VB17]